MQPEIGRLSSAVSSFMEFIHSLPAAKLEPATSETWGPREVLIHLVFWHEQYARIASDILGGKKREMLRGTFKQINAAAVSQNATATLADLLGRWGVAHEELFRISRWRQATRLKFSLREGSKEWPFLVLMRLAAGHILRHEEKLRKMLDMKRVRKTALA